MAADAELAARGLGSCPAENVRGHAGAVGRLRLRDDLPPGGYELLKLPSIGGWSHVNQADTFPHTEGDGLRLVSGRSRRRGRCGSVVCSGLSGIHPIIVGDVHSAALRGFLRRREAARLVAEEAHGRTLSTSRHARRGPANKTGPFAENG